MDARIPAGGFVFFAICIFCISDARTTEKQSSKAIRQTKRLDYQDNNMDFSYPMTATIHQGNIPVVNPTNPGTSPIINPTSPPSPTFTGPMPTTPTTSGGSWCIASQSASQTSLQVALDYACGYGGADCSAIQPSGTCFEPNTLRDHASYAFNEYYRKHPGPTSCSFGGAALIATTDPSHGSCRYASSTSTSTTTPTVPLPMTPTIPMAPTLPMPPPSTTSPINPYTPGGSGGDGSNLSPPTGFDNGFEPTGTPNSAADIALNLLLLIATNFLVFSVAIVSYS